MAVQGRVRLYREFLTPALHRRFIASTGWALLLCWVEGFLMSNKTSFFWSWFPLGPVAIPTLLLFLSALLVFLLRIDQLHLGARTTSSPWQTFWLYSRQFSVLETVLVYALSAFLFGEAYLWVSSQSAELGLIAEGEAYERPRLNDRPVYLRTAWQMHAVLQALLHLYYDHDRIDFPTASPPTGKLGEIAVVKESPRDQLRIMVPRLLLAALTRALIMSLAGPTFYVLFLRSFAWSIAMNWAGLLRNIPKTQPGWYPPFHVAMMYRSSLSSFLLVSLWKIVNLVFQIYYVLPPTKFGNPLTSDSSDPTGSLLNGLKSKKAMVKGFAFWELNNITQESEIRRKQIFSGIDRVGGSTWSQILMLCLGEIEGVNARVAEVQRSLGPSSNVPSTEVQIEKLPALGVAPKQDEILAKRPAPHVSPFPINYLDKHQLIPPIDVNSKAQQYLDSARGRLFNQRQQEVLSRQGVSTMARDAQLWFLHSVCGWTFRQTFRRRLCAVVLGTPYSDFHNILNAIDAITILSITSAQEDQLGTVSKDMPLLIRTFVHGIQSIDMLKGTMPVHWTDVEFDARGADQGRNVEEIGILLVHLKEGLKRVLEVFGFYAVELGLGPVELRGAREMVG